MRELKPDSTYYNEGRLYSPDHDSELQAIREILDVGNTEYAVARALIVIAGELRGLNQGIVHDELSVSAVTQGL